MSPSMLWVLSILLTFLSSGKGGFRCRWEAFKRQYIQIFGGAATIEFYNSTQDTGIGVSGCMHKEGNAFQEMLAGSGRFICSDGRRKYYLSQAEEELRFSIFQNNIRDLQRQPNNTSSKSIWHMKGINQYSDMTDSEPRWRLHKGRTLEEWANFAFENAQKAQPMTEYESRGHLRKLRPRVLNVWSLSLKLAVDLAAQDAIARTEENKSPPPDPGYLDLRECFNPVRDQGRCGACYAFASVAVLECGLYKKYGKRIELSEQMVVDCTKGDGRNSGCGGGSTFRVFEWLTENRAISRRNEYPYTGTDKGECKFNPRTAVPIHATYGFVITNSEDHLKEMLDEYGPVAAAINADPKRFQPFYGRDGKNAGQGLYKVPKCSSEKRNHGIVVVGYGTFRGEDYWLIRNSFGKNWGQDGYFKLARNKSNMCGVASDGIFLTSINEGF